MNGPLLKIALACACLFLGGCPASSGREADAGIDRGTGGGECEFCVPAAEICQSGVCVPAPCSATSCPIGYLCSGGFCQADSGSGCAVDEECENGRCVEGACYTFECDQGETRVCATECGDGTEICAGGVFGSCDAPRPAAEFCGDGLDQDCDGTADEGCEDCDPATAPDEICGDDFDNDCDEEIDEECPDCQPDEREECNNECGDGFRACDDGVFGECSAPLPAEEVCDAEDNDCDGTADEALERGCSTSCGDGTEVCDLGEWVDCDAPAVCDCDDGERDTQPCGLCGERTRTCVDSAWEDWGGCEDEGECEPGELQYQDCGFGSLGICELGTQQRACSGSCAWAAWSPCAGSIDPIDELCGDGIDQDCDGDDLIEDDSFEPNDTCATAWDLGLEPVNERAFGYMSSAADNDDYFVFETVDQFSITTLEHIVITLEDIPRDADYDIYLYRGLDACECNAHLASSARPGDSDEEIDWEESRVVGDDGNWYVRVRRFSGSSCEERYRLQVTGLHPL